MALKKRKEQLKEYYENPERVTSSVEGDKTVDETNPRYTWLQSEFTPHGPYSHVLHLGCGTGRWHFITSEYSDEVTGVDISHHMCIEASKKENTDNVVTGDIFNLPFRENSFDAIVSMGVLQEQVPLLDDVLREMSRVLKPDSRIFLSLKNQPKRKLIISLLLKNLFDIMPVMLIQYIENKKDMSSLEVSIDTQLAQTRYWKDDIDKPLSKFGIELVEYIEYRDEYRKRSWILVNGKK